MGVKEREKERGRDVVACLYRDVHLEHWNRGSGGLLQCCKAIRSEILAGKVPLDSEEQFTLPTVPAQLQ